MSYGRPPPRIEGMVSLKVDNLTYRTTPEDLRRVFERCGEVGDIYIPRDRFSRESRGFAFVRFYDKRDAEDALDAMDGRLLDGRELRVQMARYGRPTSPYRGARYGRPNRRRLNILDLAHDLGLEGLNERDVLDLLEAGREPLSYEELIQLQAERALGEEAEAVVSKQLTSKILSKAFSYFKQGINILRENDPKVERSAKVSQGIHSAISCYKSLKNVIGEKPRQISLDIFLSEAHLYQRKAIYRSYSRSRSRSRSRRRSRSRSRSKKRSYSRSRSRSRSDSKSSRGRSRSRSASRRNSGSGSGCRY